MITSIVEEKAFNKIQHLLIIKKTLSKLAIDRNCLSLINNIFKKPTVNNILSGEKLDVFPPKIRNKTRITPITTLFQYHTGSYSQCNKKGK